MSSLQTSRTGPFLMNCWYRTWIPGQRIQTLKPKRTNDNALISVFSISVLWVAQDCIRNHINSHKRPPSVIKFLLDFMGGICDPVQYQRNYARPVYSNSTHYPDTGYNAPYNTDAFHHRPHPSPHHGHHGNFSPFGHHGHGHHGHMSPHSHNHTRPTGGGIPFNTDAMNSNSTRRTKSFNLGAW